MLKSEGGSVLGGADGGLRKALVVAQVTVSLLLMVGAGVFLKSLDNLLAIDPGFETTQLLSFNVSPGSFGTSRPQPRRSPRRCSTACAPHPA